MIRKTFLVAVGQRISKARIAQGYTQAFLAEKANISISHLSNIERGRKCLSAEVLCKISEALQVSADSLLLPDIPQTNRQVEHNIEFLLKECTVTEKEFILRIIKEMNSLIIKVKSECK